MFVSRDAGSSFSSDFTPSSHLRWNLAPQIPLLKLKLKPWSNGLASSRKLKTWAYLRLRLARPCVHLRWLAITLVEIKFARKSMPIFYRLATQRKSLRKFNLPLLTTTCESVWPWNGQKRKNSSLMLSLRDLSLRDLHKSLLPPWRYFFQSSSKKHSVSYLF